MRKLNKIDKFVWAVYWVLIIISIVWMWNLIIMNESVYVGTNPKIFFRMLVMEIGTAVILNLIVLILQDAFFANFARYTDYAKYNEKNIMKTTTPADKMIILFVIFEIIKRVAEWQVLFEGERGELGLGIIGVISCLVMAILINKVALNEAKKKRDLIHTIKMANAKFLKENDAKETAEVKYDKMKIVIFEDNTEHADTVTSSFNLMYKQNPAISDNIFYIDYKNDLPAIMKKDNDLYKELVKNMAMFLRVTDNENDNIDKLMEYCKNKNLTNKQCIVVFAGTSKDVPSIYDLVDYVKICEKKDYIEVVEKALKEEVSYKGITDYRLFKQMFSQKGLINRFYRLFYKALPNTQIDSMIRYNRRFLEEIDHMPKAPLLQTMYKNAFAQDSAQRSYLLLLNYINCLNQIMCYYAYLKNQNTSKEIDHEIIQDDYDTFAFTLKRYLDNDKESLYKRIRKNEYEITPELRNLIDTFFSNIVGNKFEEGNKITYYGAIELVGKIRDKAHAHGTVDEGNTFAYWNLIFEVSKLFNEIFEAEKINISLENNHVYVSYDGISGKVDMSDYIVANNEIDMFIVQSAGKNNKKDVDYVNYLAGRYVRPAVKSVEKGGKSKK